MDAEYREPEYEIVGRYGPSSCSHPVDSSDLQSKEANTQPKCLPAASPYCTRIELFRGVVSGTSPGVCIDHRWKWYVVKEVKAVV